MNHDMLVAVLRTARLRGLTGELSDHAAARAINRFGGAALPEIAAKLRGHEYKSVRVGRTDLKHGSVRVKVTLDDGRVAVAALAPKCRNAAPNPNRPVAVKVTTVMFEAEDEEAWDDIASRGRGVSHDELAEVERRREADKALERHLRDTCPASVREMLRF